VGVQQRSAGSYLSAGRWLSALISWRNSTALLGRHAARQPGLHGFELGRPTAQFLLPVEELERLLLNDLHAPLDVFLRLIGLGPRIGDRRLRLGEDRLLSSDILLSDGEVLAPSCELVFALVGLRLPISHPLLAVQELDGSALEELPLAREFPLLAIVANRVLSSETRLSISLRVFSSFTLRPSASMRSLSRAPTASLASFRNLAIWASASR